MMTVHRSIPVLLAVGGCLMVVPTAQSSQAIDRMHELFPSAVVEMEAQCEGDLVLQAIRIDDDTERVSFTCWRLDANGDRVGEWLGNVPTSATDSAFFRPLTCAEGDEDCVALLPAIRSRYTDQLAAAEFECSSKNGTLFLQFPTETAIAPEDSIDLRCGFFATSLIDRNNDQVADDEDSVSVDISLATFDRAALSQGSGCRS
ncbi:MAG: hypothetical protein HC895_04355 [Leptolyngbyaceae cyanobacterium SM1_3_5]|nr:hypothetical protein [Leptolyngbyaceae cyanobacterium SM1_3_5]